MILSSSTRRGERERRRSPSRSKIQNVYVLVYTLNRNHTPLRHWQWLHAQKLNGPTIRYINQAIIFDLICTLNKTNVKIGAKKMARLHMRTIFIIQFMNAILPLHPFNRIATRRQSKYDQTFFFFFLIYRMNCLNKFALAHVHVHVYVDFGRFCHWLLTFADRISDEKQFGALFFFHLKIVSTKWLKNAQPITHFVLGAFCQCE